MALTQVQGGMIVPSTTLTTPIVATTMGVGGATPAASGAGITFPAGQSASTDANTLDDYEEGTWTPTLTGNTTYTKQVGRYTKIGRLVTATGTVTVNTLGTGVTSSVFGLPFVAGGVSGELYSGSVGYYANAATLVSAMFLRVNPTTSQIDFGATTVADATVSTVNIFTNGTTVSFVVQYEV
jgi:hypothetical protein